MSIGAGGIILPTTEKYQFLKCHNKTYSSLQEKNMFAKNRDQALENGWVGC